MLIIVIQNASFFTNITYIYLVAVKRDNFRKKNQLSTRSYAVP